MLIECKTRGCLQQTEAKYDKEADQVICDACGNSISDVSRYAKKALAGIGQVVRHKARPFQSLCKSCNKNRSLYVSEEKAYCKTCGTQVVITPAFLQGLKNYLASNDE